MLANGRPRTRFRPARRGIVGATIPLVALVLIPSAMVAGLVLGSPPTGGSGPTSGVTSGVSVSITALPACLLVPSGVVHDLCLAPPGTLRLAAVVSGGAPPYVYVWSFGDGTSPGVGQTLLHTFPGCGAYVVGVVVFSAAGTGSDSTTVHACPLL
jgi:hypothetical protein